MAREMTGAERYMAQRLEDPEFKRLYDEARARIDRIDSIVRAFDERRVDLTLTKADLARRADMKPEAVRRLFSAQSPNPTLSTLVALANALDLEFLAVPRQSVPVS